MPSSFASGSSVDGFAAIMEANGLTCGRCSAVLTNITLTWNKPRAASCVTCALSPLKSISNASPSSLWLAKACTDVIRRRTLILFSLILIFACSVKSFTTECSEVILVKACHLALLPTPTPARIVIRWVIVCVALGVSLESGFGASACFSGRRAADGSVRYHGDHEL